MDAAASRRSRARNWPPSHEASSATRRPLRPFSRAHATAVRAIRRRRGAAACCRHFSSFRYAPARVFSAARSRPAPAHGTHRLDYYMPIDILTPEQRACWPAFQAAHQRAMASPWSRQLAFGRRCCWVDIRQQRFGQPAQLAGHVSRARRYQRRRHSRHAASS